jgi:hypothetical protein
MGRWSRWLDAELAKLRTGRFNDFGIYQIRIVTPSGKPIQICRIGGIDQTGIIYIGRSGYRLGKTNRTVANRIQEFIKEQHSGGCTYAKAKSVLQKMPQYKGHLLQVRAMFVPNKDIKNTESNELKKYFSSYAELPPCNSSLPNPQK